MALSKLSFFVTKRRQKQITNCGCLIYESFSSTVQTHETLSPKSSITRSSSTNKPPKPLKIDSNNSSLEILKHLPPADTNFPPFQKLGYMAVNFSSTTRNHHTLSSKSPKVIQKLGMDGNIRKTKGVPLQPFEAFDQLMDYFVRNGKFDEALLVVKTIMFKICNSPSSNDLLEYLFRNRRMDLAFHHFNTMTDKDIRTFEIFLVALCYKKMIEETLMVLDQMFEFVKSTSSGPPTCLDFYAIVLAFVYKLNEPDKVSQLLRLMTESDNAHNMLASSKVCMASMTEVYCDTVKGFCYLWRFDDAAKFLEEHSVSEFGPYLDLLECYCNAGMLDEANDVHELMLKKNLNSIYSWTTLIKALCGEDEYDKAFATLKRMIACWDKKHILANETRTSLVPPPDSFASALDEIISDSRKGLPDMDEVLILAMRTMLVSGLWKEGHEHDATELGKNGTKNVAELPGVC